MVFRNRLLSLSLSIVFLVISLFDAPTPGAQTAQARSVRPVSVVGDLIDITRANDERNFTRANAGTPSYSRLSITLDLGGEHNIIGVIQDHGRWATQYPGAYRVEVTASLSGRWDRVFEGPGQRSESKATFDAVRGRFIRITATETRRGGEDWSIAEVRVIVDPAASPRRGTWWNRDRDRANDPRSDRSLRDVNLAFDRNLNTRATSGAYDYTGTSFTFDLEGEYDLSRVVQLHAQWADDYPAEYKIEVSRDQNESRFREVFRGAGEPGRSIAQFAPVFTRYIRITALRNRDTYHWWSIAELRTNRDQDWAQDRDRPVDSRNDRPVREVNLAFDRNLTTRATSGVYDYAGYSLTFDLEGEYELSRVVQLHGQWADDYPAEYKIEVSSDRNDSRFREVFRGAGAAVRSIAQFAPVRTRYVRVTALRSRDRSHWWSIAELRTNRDQDVTDLDLDEDDQLSPREIRRVDAQGIANASAVGDGRGTTRATTNTSTYAGSWIQVDLGGTYSVSRVVQIHDPDGRDYPGRYRIEISDNGSQWRGVFQGQGERGRSVAIFNPVRTRFLRITAIANHDLQHWWSIYKLKVRG